MDVLTLSGFFVPVAFTRTWTLPFVETVNLRHCLSFMKVRVVGFGFRDPLGIGVRVAVEVFVGVAVAVFVGVAVAVGVGVCVDVGVRVGVPVDVGVGVGVGTSRSVSVTRRVESRGNGFVDVVSKVSVCESLLFNSHCELERSYELTLEYVLRPISMLTKSEGRRQRLSSKSISLSELFHLSASTL